MNEERMTEVEKRLAFQDHMISELNEVIIEQRKLIDSLALRVSSLEKESSADGIIKPLSEEEPPPHY